MTTFHFIFFIPLLYHCSADEFEITALDIEALLEKSEAFKQLKQRVSLLEEHNLEQQHLISKLTNDMTKQKLANTKLRETVADLKSRLADENSTGGNFNHINRQNNNATSIQPKLRKPLSGDKSQYEGRGISRRQILSNIAFSAGLTGTKNKAGINEKIIFDQVITNVGNGYNNLLGEFVAPVHGIYIFHASVMAESNKEVYCRFVVNGTYHLNAMYANGFNGGHGQGSQSTIVLLKQHDSVSVQNMATEGTIFSSVDLYTFFSGFLLAPDVSM
ncbi:positive regulation of adiponectin secretion [Mactra antiquata]